MDGEVLWEELGKSPEDLTLEEMNTFFKKYVDANPDRFKWLEANQQKKRAKLMRLEITPNLRYENVFLKRSRQVENVADLGNGQQERHRLWQRNTEPKVEGTEANGKGNTTLFQRRKGTWV